MDEPFGRCILSAALMLDHMGFHEAASRVRNAILSAIEAKTVTSDLANEMEGATAVSCSEFGRILLSCVEK